ncbi:MAG: SHIRT domain-containing protein, partial [Oscillospiraceae bacterium]|nr:SHIRT domain-containing protein [Oscillospiraceae bacterium]
MLPTNSHYYITGQDYTVDTEYTNGTVLYTHDEYGNVTGTYTFNGWDKSNGTIENADVEVTGTWTYAEQTVPEYKVTYSWEGLPEDGTTLYDADGNVVTPTEPADETGLVNGQSYTIDTTYTSATVVYTKDQYGNVNGKYTFSGWDKNDGTIENADVEVTGTWTYAEQT